MHRHSPYLAFAAVVPALALIVPFAVQAAKPGARPFIVAGDGVMPATIGGVAGRIRVTPWAPPAPVLNPDMAARIGLKGGWFGIVLKVGPVKVPGKTSVTRLGFAGMDFRRRVVWFDRRYDAGADAAIGPGGVPADVIRFNLGDPLPGERTVVMPMVQNLFQPTFSRIIVGGRAISILFDPQHVRTLATANAGAAIAAANGGKLVSGQGKAEIAFGIDRPVRTLKLATPLMVGPLRLDSMAVRIADGGSVSGIPDADADPDEIVVTAGKKRPGRDVLIIGREQLDRCSSITYDKRAKTITLSCA